jgi:predicted Zn-dependent protease
MIDVVRTDTGGVDIRVASEVLQMLMEIGYVAIGRGFQEQAEKIFTGIAAARPRSELPLIGLAVTHLNFGDFAGASRILLEQALVANPNSGLAKCFLAVSMRALGANNEANWLAGEALKAECGPETKALAGAFISGKDVGATAPSVDK